MSERYLEPGWFTRNVFNRAVRRLTRMGLSVYGSAELRVRGRSSGEWRTTPVNVLTRGGVRYLVAPRGVTQWVRNLRAAGTGELRVGRATTPFTANELSDDAKLPVVRAYLEKWAWETSQFFENISAASPDDDLRTAAPGFPVFAIATI